VVGLWAVFAARDAATAAKEQVFLQSFPNVETAVNPRPLAGVTYPDGRRLPRSHESPYDVAIVGQPPRPPTLYLALALQNGGTGFAVIHEWRWQAAEELTKRPYQEPDFGPPRRRIVLPPSSRELRLELSEALPLPLAPPLLVRAVSAGRPVALEIFYSDLSRDRKQKTTIVLEKVPGTRYWQSTLEDLQDDWKATPGLDNP
jgi:hypothetical protein